MFRLVWLRGGAATSTEPFWVPRERPRCTFSQAASWTLKTPVSLAPSNPSASKARKPYIREDYFSGAGQCANISCLLIYSKSQRRLNFCAANLTALSAMKTFWDFFGLLPNPDKEFFFMSSIDHAAGTSKNYLRFYPAAYAFLPHPETVFKG